MIIQCPHCGKPVVVNGIGRKRLDMPVNLICDALRDSSTVEQAAQILGCSRGYIYKVLKDNGLKVKDIIANSQS